MKSSVVNIESVSNNAFGTGFVIDSNEKGVYILTCQHVLDDVETPVVENVLAKVIARGEFIDMAVIYVSKLQLKPLILQETVCENLEVEVIGFSIFNKTLTQKKHIDATLYKKSIELHSKEDDDFYTVRKIKANDGFNFDRGNSGSPVICKKSGAVIAMVSNKEGSELAYAIDIKNLKSIWEKPPSKLFQAIPKEQKTIEKTEEIIEEISGKKEIPLKPLINKKKSPILKYFFFVLLLLGFLITAYTLSKDSTPLPKIDKKELERKEQLALKKKALEIRKEKRERKEQRAKEIRIKELQYKKEKEAEDKIQHEMQQKDLNRKKIMERKILLGDKRTAISHLKQNRQGQTVKGALKIAELYNTLENEENNAIEWYKKAESLGYIKAKYPLSILYCKQGNFSKFMSSTDILTYAKDSRKEFKYDIGLCYNELGNIKEARVWFKASASMGYKPAKEALFIILTGELGYKAQKAHAIINAL